MRQAGALVKDQDAIGLDRVRLEYESIVLTQKGDPAAAHGVAFRLVLRALIEAAESAEICAGRVEDKHVDLYTFHYIRAQT